MSEKKGFFGLFKEKDGYVIGKKADAYVKGRELASHKLMRWGGLGAVASALAIAYGPIWLVAIGLLGLPAAVALGMSGALANTVRRRIG